MDLATALTRAARGLSVFLAITTLGLAAATGASAQGVTTGAIRGRVNDQAGQPIAGVAIQAVNRQSGTRFQAATNARGIFYIANVIVGPYEVDVLAIGYRRLRDTVNVTLGSTADMVFRMEAVAVQLAEITVTGEEDRFLLSRGRTGAATLVTEQLIRNLPSFQRNFTDFAATNPLVHGRAGSAGISIAGQNDRFNNLQIDGGSNNDLFGLNSTRGSPGGRNDSRPISVEAVREYQVLIAPFDVRQGGFTGGLVNAVTRSGTNEFHGSVFGYAQDDALQGKDSIGGRAGEFDRSFYGFTFGGPIVRDRFHFFVAAEWRRDNSPFGGLVIGPDTTGGADSVGVGIRQATAARVRQYAIDSLGFDPGGFGRPTIPNPDRSLFFKLSGQLGMRSQVELAYNTVASNLDVLVHDATGANSTRLREGYQYDQSGYDNSSKNQSIRGRLNTQLSTSLTNEVIVSFQRVEDIRQIANRAPVIIVGADRRAATPGALPTTFLALGGERFSHANTLDQDILEISNNVTWSTGPHVFTFGGRVESFNFRNVFFPASLGAWFFPDTSAFFGSATGGVPAPTRYELALPGVFADSVNGRSDGPIADFKFSQFGLYAQDQWRAARGLTLTLGMRLDFTALPQPAYNPLVDTVTLTAGPRLGEAFGVRTDTRATDRVLFSPRLGFNYDVHADRNLMIRGGIGLFAGRTPYVWASNAYTNTGLEQVQLTCDAGLTGPVTTDSVPTFTADPSAQPTACRGPGGALALPTPAIVYFDQDFRLPQTLRLSLGVDRRLPWGMVGSVEGLFTRSIQQFYLEDVNLIEGGTSLGEGNRRLYGTLSTTSSASTPRRGTARARDVLLHSNSNEDYSYSLTFMLNKRFSDHVEFLAGYTFSHSFDLISLTSDISNSLLNFATLDGTMSNRRLTKSLFDIPHSVRLSGTATLPYGVRVSMFYTGRSGRPFAYRYGSDVNGDGFNGNDLIYVPMNATDISLATPSQYPLLDAFINAEPCLRNSRGRILERGACRNPWQGFLDARLAKTFQTIRGQSIELTANIFNVPALLGVGGTIRETTGFENVAIMNRTGYSNALGRGIYSLSLIERNRASISLSRWKLEFGGRYTF